MHVRVQRVSMHFIVILTFHLNDCAHAAFLCNEGVKFLFPFNFYLFFFLNACWIFNNNKKIWNNKENCGVILYVLYMQDEETQSAINEVNATNVHRNTSIILQVRCMKSGYARRVNTTCTQQIFHILVRPYERLYLVYVYVCMVYIFSIYIRTHMSEWIIWLRYSNTYRRLMNVSFIHVPYTVYKFNRQYDGVHVYMYTLCMCIGCSCSFFLLCCV